MSLRQLQEDKRICLSMGCFLPLDGSLSLLWLLLPSANQLNVLQQIDIKASATLSTYYDNVTQRKTTMERQFCSNCGCPVFWRLANIGDNILVAGGTLMTPNGKPGQDSGQTRGAMLDWKPTTEFFCETRLGWVGEIGGTQKVEGMPPVGQPPN